jgi:outer membrane immunogenic protein
MRCVFIVLGLLLLLGKPSYSADLPLKAPYYYPEINWTGTYVGLSGGFAGGKSHGPLGTLSFGINFQTYSRLVYGVEADFSFGKLAGDIACAGCDFDDRWLATARARFGYMFGRTLVFATAGLASGDVRANGPGGTSTAIRVGYAVGGGAEFDLGRDWSLRADYLHVDLGTFDCGVVCGVGAPQFRASSEVVRIGLVYRFFQEAVEEYNVFGPPIKPPPF